MERIPHHLCVALALVAGSACTPEAPPMREEIDRVEAVANGLMAADNDRNVERVVELYAPNAVLMPPGESPVAGIAAIRPRYESFFQTYRPELRFEIDETTAVGDLAYVTGRTLGTIHGPEEGTDQSVNDVFLMILRRTNEGSWNISRLMWHATGN